MKTPTFTWIPSLKWHCVCLGICLVISALCVGALCLLSTHLPAPYQPRTPLEGTTPWND